MKKNLTRYYTFFIAVILITIIMTLTTISIIQNNPKPIPTPTSYPPVPFTSITPKQLKPPSLHDIPTNIPQKGGGIDLTDKTVQESIIEIQKLHPSIPYTKDVTFPNGMTVSILIPPSDLQSSPWTLSVELKNIDYYVHVTDPKFLIMKSAFRKSASIVFDWIREKGANPDKILFQWGDRRFIQNQAERWLYNN